MVRRSCRLFSRDQRGLAAVEFALIAPILILLFLCVVEVSNLLSADAKMRAATAAVGDLVTQDSDGMINAADIAILQAASRAIMAPIPVNSNQLTIYVTNYSVDASSNVTVSWRRRVGRNGDPAATGSGACTPNGLPVSLRASTNDVVRVDGNYTWTPMFMPGWTSLTLKSTTYNMPRYFLRLTLASGPKGC